MRLIDADALADNLEKQSEYVKNDALLLRIIASGLRHDEAFAPTIDPASLRPKGEWVFDSGVDYCYKCSACKGLHPPHYIDDNFCPNCGADMRGGERGA